MSAKGQELRCQIRDLLIMRAWRSDELAAVVGVNEGTVCHAIVDLKEAGLPVSEWGWGMYHIVYPRGRVCAECSTILRISNPTDRCEVHGGGCYPPYEPPLQEKPMVCPRCHETTYDYADTRRCRRCVNEYATHRADRNRGSAILTA